MEKERDKQPIDDLFARKLREMSLPPSADGFERLQARMAQQDGTLSKAGLWGLWHNPTVPRYMAVAACLLVVCLVGWLYSPISSVLRGSSVAIHQSSHGQKTLHYPSRKTTSEQVATVSTETGYKHEPLSLSKAHHEVNNVSKLATPVAANQVASAVEPVQPIKSAPTPIELATIASASPSQIGQLLENTAKSAPQAERVLVVTIEEPAVLAVAQQERSEPDEKSVTALTDKLAKDVKAGNLWQKVKQLRQGELLAKSDNTTDDDQGLISRAYTGLKHSIEKGKTTRQ